MTGPKIYPVVNSRQEDVPLRCSFLGHGIDQERRPEHELVLDILKSWLVREFQRERTHECFPAIGNAPCCRVNVWQEAIAKNVILSQDLFHFRTVLPYLSLGMKPMDAKNGTE